MKRSPEVVKRWVNEVQEAVNSDNNMVQVPIADLLTSFILTFKLCSESSSMLLESFITSEKRTVWL